MKQINEMSIQELFELKTIVDTISKTYMEELTTYAHLNSDLTLQNLSPREQSILNKQSKNNKLSSKLMILIEEKLQKYYD